MTSDESSDRNQLDAGNQRTPNAFIEVLGIYVSAMYMYFFITVKRTRSLGRFVMMKFSCQTSVWLNV